MTNEEKQAAYDAVNEWISLCVNYPCEAPVNVHLDVVTSLDILEVIRDALSSPAVPVIKDKRLEEAIWYCREDWQHKDGYESLYEEMDVIIERARSSSAVPVIEGLDAEIEATQAAYEADALIFKASYQAARAYAALPKLQKVDLEAMLLPNNSASNDGYNAAIEFLKSKYGELYFIEGE